MEIRAEVKFVHDDIFDVTVEPSKTALRLDKRREGYAHQGPNPLELFLSALAGCVGVYAKMYLVRHSIAFSGLAVKAQAEFIQEHPARLGNIAVRVSTDARLEEKKETFLRFIKNCPIHNTLLHSGPIDISL